MSLPVDERLISVEKNLVAERDKLLTKKVQLLEKFQSFVLNKLKTSGKTFKVEFHAINGNQSIFYNDLNMHDEFVIQCGSFIFDPKTNLLTNYVRIEYRETKTFVEFDDLFNNSKNKPRVFRKFQQPLAKASELEKSRVNEIMQKKVEKILEGIFNGKLRFSEPEFEQLVTENSDLEGQLQEINTRIAALGMINGSSVSPQPKQEKKHPIIQFLEEEGRLDDRIVPGTPKKLS